MSKKDYIQEHLITYLEMVCKEGLKKDFTIPQIKSLMGIECANSYLLYCIDTMVVHYKELRVVQRHDRCYVIYDRRKVGRVR